MRTLATVITCGWLSVSAGCYLLGGDEDGASTDAGPELVPRSPDEDGDGFPDGWAGDPDTQREGCDTGDRDCDQIPDAQDVDVDGDGLLDAVPPQELLDALSPITDSFCASIAECCPGSWSAEAIGACSFEALGNLATVVAQDWALGYVVADPAGLETCLAATAVDCSTRLLPAPDLSGCRDYLVGQRAALQVCFRDFDCAAGLGCPRAGLRWSECWASGFLCRVKPSEGSGELSQCRPIAAVGEPCAAQLDEALPTCERGLWCDPSLSVCRLALEVGDECEVYGQSDGGDSCTYSSAAAVTYLPGLYCSEDGACAPLLPEGARCLEDRVCEGACDIVAELCGASSSEALDFCAVGTAFGL